MREVLNNRAIYYIGFYLIYSVAYEFIGFENTVILCMGTIIGEQAYVAANKKKND